MKKQPLTRVLSDETKTSDLDKAAVISRSDIEQMLLRVVRETLGFSGIDNTQIDKIMSDSAELFGTSMDEQLDAAQKLIADGMSFIELEDMFTKQIFQGMKIAEDYSSIDEFVEKNLSDGFPKNGL